MWLGFSPDSKFFIGQGGGPDWVLVYWHWEKAKILATAKVSAPANHPVHQVSSLVTIQSCELHLVFLYRCPSTLRTTLKCVLSVKSCSNYFAIARAISSSLLSPKLILRTTCVTPGSLKIIKLLMGTSAGKVQLFEVADLKQEYYLTSPPGTSSQVSTDM